MNRPTPWRWMACIASGLSYTVNSPKKVTWNQRRGGCCTHTMQNLRRSAFSSWVNAGLVGTRPLTKPGSTALARRSRYEGVISGVANSALRTGCSLLACSSTARGWGWVAEGGGGLGREHEIGRERHACHERAPCPCPCSALTHCAPTPSAASEPCLSCGPAPTGFCGASPAWHPSRCPWAR